jgi:hypothetical protein
MFGDGGLAAVWWTGPLVVHFQKKKTGEPLDIVAIGDPVVAEQVAVVSDFVDQIGGGGGHQAPSGGAIAVSSGNSSKSAALKV